MAVFLIRLAAVLLTVAAVAIAVTPILVLIDLVGGGAGYGLCPTGIESCDKPYSTGAELAVLLTIGLGLSVFGIRLLTRLARRLQEGSPQRR